MPAEPDELGDVSQHSEIITFGTAQRKTLEEREDPVFELAGAGDFKVEDTVTPSAYRADAERIPQQDRKLRTDLRDVERDANTPWQSTVVLSTEGDVEASLSVDESTDPVTEVTGDSIQPV
jgi:hypothetical protein